MGKNFKSHFTKKGGHGWQITSEKMLNIISHKKILIKDSVRYFSLTHQNG